MASIRRTLFPATPNSDSERCTDNSLSVLTCSEASEGSNTEKDCDNGGSVEFHDVVLEENTVIKYLSFIGQASSYNTIVFLLLLSVFLVFIGPCKQESTGRRREHG